MALVYHSTATPIGQMMLAATERGICFLQFGDTQAAMLRELESAFPESECQPASGKQCLQLVEWTQALAQYFRGAAPIPDLPLDIQGTVFQMKVWTYLRKIPAGKPESYTQVASAIGHPKAVRAVASACAKNNVSIIIPCHRVIRGSGALAGYRWGVERKQKLLAMEGKEN